MGMGAYAIVGGLRLGKRAMDQKHERELAAMGGGNTEEIGELRERVERLEEVGFRVQEIEERLDFAERMLTSGREAPKGS
jgi:NTP pyrophosphatase (non-canonical NTP hydrolase)